MAKPSTLLELATLRQDTAKAEVTAAQKQLADARKEIAAARAKLTKAANEQAALEKHAEAIRQKLAAVPTAADGETLLEALELIYIRNRARQAETLRAGAELAAAQTAANQAQAAFTNISAALVSAEDQVRQASQGEKQRNVWKTALTTPPLATLNNDADAALNAAPFTDAKARIELDLPQKLRTRAQQRRTQEAKRIAATASASTAAEDALLEERAKNGGLAGQVSRARRQFLRAQAAAQQFAEQAQSQFEHAQATLAAVVDTNHFPLSSEQLDRLNDASLKSDRESAADAEKDLDDKHKDMDDKQTALDEEVLKALAAGQDPDTEQDVNDAKDALKTAKDAFEAANTDWRQGFAALESKVEEVSAKETALAVAIQNAVAANTDPDTAPEVTQARNDLKTAQDDLKQAEKNYRQSKHGLVHAWAAAAPDTTWRLLDQFEHAKATLNHLKGSDPAKLNDDLEKAEADYVEELLKAGESDRILDQLTAEHTLRHARHESAAAAAPARFFNALRGDR